MPRSMCAGTSFNLTQTTKMKTSYSAGTIENFLLEGLVAIIMGTRFHSAPTLEIQFRAPTVKKTVSALVSLYSAY